MTAAIFGLVGVLVGALVTGGVDYWMTKRRENADLKMAKRLVADDLETAYMHHDLLVKNGHYPTRGVESGRFMPDEAWQAHRSILALRIESDESWKLLARCMRSVVTTRMIIEDEAPGAAISPGRLKEFERGVAVVRDAHVALTGEEPETP